MKYASFWRSFAAYWLDIIFFIPVIAFSFYGALNWRLFQMYWLIPGIALDILFNVYLVIRFGGTPGKLLLHTKIVMADGSSVTRQAAIYRYSVELIFIIITSMATLYAYSEISNEDFYSINGLGRLLIVSTHLPNWHRYADYLMHLWIWSEFITMLFNRKRRAVHDLIAGTVVIKNI